jgi:hypothetical protein
MITVVCPTAQQLTLYSPQEQNRAAQIDDITMDEVIDDHDQLVDDMAGLSVGIDKTEIPHQEAILSGKAKVNSRSNPLCCPSLPILSARGLQ